MGPSHCNALICRWPSAAMELHLLPADARDSLLSTGAAPLLFMQLRHLGPVPNLHTDVAARAGVVFPMLGD